MKDNPNPTVNPNESSALDTNSKNLKLRQEKLAILDGDKIAGQIINDINGKNYIYNAGSNKWHIFENGENVLNAKYPEK